MKNFNDMPHQTLAGIDLIIKSPEGTHGISPQLAEQIKVPEIQILDSWDKLRPWDIRPVRYYP